VSLVLSKTETREEVKFNMELREIVSRFFTSDAAGAEADTRTTVQLYAQIHELKKQLKVLEGKARDHAIDLYEGYGLTALSGDEGVVTIAVIQGSKRLDTKAVRKLLTAEQLEEVTVQGKPSTRIQFTPKTEDK
jgi:hypothetical protein